MEDVKVERRVALRAHELDDGHANVGDHQPDEGRALREQQHARIELDAIIDPPLGAARACL